MLGHRTPATPDRNFETCCETILLLRNTVDRLIRKPRNFEETCVYRCWCNSLTVALRMRIRFPDRAHSEFLKTSDGLADEAFGDRRGPRRLIVIQHLRAAFTRGVVACHLVSRRLACDCTCCLLGTYSIPYKATSEYCCQAKSYRRNSFKGL